MTEPPETSDGHLRVLHVVPLITPEGRYGGPVRVAVNQLRALDGLGVAGMIVGGSAGYKKRRPTHYGTVRARLFVSLRVLPSRARFAGYFSPGLLWWLWRNARGFGIVHIHQSRDLNQLLAAWVVMMRRIPYVVQTHGMIAPRSRATVRIVDVLLTRRVLRRAAYAYTLTNRENRELLAVADSGVALRHLPNGVPLPAALTPEPKALEVLFISRLEERKHPEYVAIASVELADEFPDVVFSVVGSDQGALRSVLRVRDEAKRAGLHPRLELSGAVSPETAIGRIERAAVVALPSVEEPFPMVILEAMSYGKPVVITRECGVATSVTEAWAGIVIAPEPQEFVAAIRELLGSTDLREQMGRNGFHLVRDRLSDIAVARVLAADYQAVAHARGLPR